MATSNMNAGRFPFRDEERRALALAYAEAAQDPEFRADNEVIERDFAVLDREADFLLG